MKITTKHKAYALILAVGFAALGADHGLARPQSADAEQITAQAIVSDSTPDVGVLNGLQNTLGGASLAKRLATMTGTGGVDFSTLTDAFAPSKSFKTQRVVSQQQTSNSAQEFARTHVLSAVMQSSKGGQAIVNGKLFHAGQLIDGMKLVSIGRNFARLSDGVGQFDLFMQTASVQSDIQSN